MNIEIGTTYQTRDGNTAVVEAEYPDEPNFPFFGKCFDRDGAFDRIAFWARDGRYALAHPCQFDLVGKSVQ